LKKHRKHSEEEAEVESRASEVHEGERPSPVHLGIEKEDVRFRRLSVLTIFLVVVFILSAMALVGVMNLSVVRKYFQGESVFWVLRIGVAFIIVLLIIYLVSRERSNVRYVRRLLERREEVNKRLASLIDAGRSIGSTLDVIEVLSETVSRICDFTGATFGTAYVKPRGEEILRLELSKGVEKEKILFKEFPIGHGLVGSAAAEGKIKFVEDASSMDERDNPFFGSATPGSLLVLPLVARERLSGLVVVGTEEKRSFSFDEIRLLEGIAEMAGLSLSNAQLYHIARRSLGVATRQKGLAESVLEGIVAGVITCDSNGRVQVFNREAQRLTGFSFAERTQARLRPDTDIDSNPLGTLENAMLEVLNSGNRKEGEALIMKKDRTLLPVSYRVYPLSSEGNVLGAAAVFLESKAEMTQVSGKEDIEYHALLRALGARVENLYVQPLRRVLGRIEGMDSSQWSESKDNIVRTLEAGLEALSGLLEDMEQYMNCTTIREWDLQEEIGISSLVSEVVEEILKSREFQGVVIMVRLFGLPDIYGYPRLVKSALREVVENAAFASLDGERKVEISGARRNGFLRISISDTGPGISTEARSFIFRPFFSTWEGHSGLGLAACHRIMKKLGGKVGVEFTEEEGGNKKGSGAHFFLEFPLPHEIPE